jgi:saccharopine dehydrogenase (NAD+, L-lysine-forming)
MKPAVHLWLRAETKAHEARTPLTPAGAKALREAGFRVTVERSSDRVFGDAAYQGAGAELAAAGSWKLAPADALILGLKELPPPNISSDRPLRHRHIYFAHAFKEQRGWQDTLARFVQGGGTLLDLEYLTDDDGRRIAAFGHWAGYAGAAVGLSVWLHHQLRGPEEAHPPLRPFDGRDDWVRVLKAGLSQTKMPRAMIIGALGRCGRGAAELFDALDVPTVAWDQAETARGGPFEAILDVDLFVNAVFLGGPVPPFLDPSWLHRERRLRVVADVSCDPDSPHNPIPLYDRNTTFGQPALQAAMAPPLWVVAIDHLPSLLPRESSEDYGGQLLPHLLALGTKNAVWQRAQSCFMEKSAPLR